MASMIIAGEDCKNCIYNSVDDLDKSKVMVECKIKAKKYHWGQCVPCDLKEEIKIDRAEEI